MTRLCAPAQNEPRSSLLGLDPTTLPAAVSFGLVAMVTVGVQAARERATHCGLGSRHYIQRDPFVHDVLAELVVHARSDTTGRELRGMAYRAGLPV